MEKKDWRWREIEYMHVSERSLVRLFRAFSVLASRITPEPVGQHGHTAVVSNERSTSIARDG